MDLRFQRMGVKWPAVMAMFVGMSLLAGCNSGERFRPAYLADTSRLVGGGLTIQWKAPEPGTVYLVEKRTGKLVQTATMEAGESFDFRVESMVDAEELGDMLGINIARAQFLLYFKPAGPESGAPRP